MKISTRIIIITISNNLGRNLLSVFFSSEAQVPKDVIHQMQQHFVENKLIREFLLFRVHTPGKDCIIARWAWQTLPYWKGAAILTFGLLRSKVRPLLPQWWDARFISKDPGKGRKVISKDPGKGRKGRSSCQECKRRNIQTIACWPSPSTSAPQLAEAWRKNVDSTWHV